MLVIASTFDRRGARLTVELIDLDLVPQRLTPDQHHHLALGLEVTVLVQDRRIDIRRRDTTETRP